MAVQVRRCLRCSVRLQISGRGAQDAGIVGQFATLKAAIGQWGAAQRQVETAFDRVKAGVRQPQIQCHVGILPVKIGQKRHDMQLGKAAGGGKAEGA